MTLNITAISWDGIHQSSDMRLTAFLPGPDGKLIPIEENSPKLITMVYANWAGYLTYCGIGMFDNRPTYSYAADWITSAGPNPSFKNVVEILELKGSEWITEFEDKYRKTFPHSFILAGYENRLPSFAIISNSHSTRGKLPNSIKRGLVASFGSRSGTHVYVTGLHNAVQKEERVALKRMVEKKVAAKIIRHRMANINENAAKSTMASNGIGSSCICYSMDRNGGGSGEICGRGAGPLLPIQIRNGVNITDFLGKIVGPNARIVQTVFTNQASSNSVAAKNIDCVLEFPVSSQFSRVIGNDLGRLNDFYMKIQSANRSGAIAGQLRYPINACPQAFLWIKGQKILALGSLGGSGSHACDVNSYNDVVGASQTVEGTTRAFLWSSHTGILDLGVVDGNCSEAKSINDNNIVVGRVYRTPAPLPGHERAFVWTRAAGMRIIEGLEDRWSQAHHINSSGEILGWCDGPHQRCSFIYSPTQGLKFIDGKLGRPFYATAMNNLGDVIGEAEDESGARQAMIWTADFGLKRMHIPFSFHPRSIDDEGNIVGYDSKKPWSSAWLLAANGELICLPGGANHSVIAQKITGSSIYGCSEGEGWKHTHPIRWDFMP